MSIRVLWCRLLLAICGSCLLCAPVLLPAQVLSVQVGSPPQPPTVVSNLLFAHGDDWYWRRGTNAPQANWMTAPETGLDSTWTVAAGGFGYGDNAIVGEGTRVDPGMLNVHTTLYIRGTITIPTALNTN